MQLLGLPAALLAWLGRQGTRAVAVSLLLGIALPPLAATFKPFVPEAIFVLLVLAFLRVDPGELRAYFAQPRLILLATLWIMVAMPALLGVAFLVIGVDKASPALLLALVLQASAAPIMSAPAFAALMGLDAALSLATLLLCMATTPLTAPLFAHGFAGATFALSPLSLGWKLFVLLAGSAAVAWTIRAIAGRAWVAAQRQRIDGLNVVTLFVFALAVMDGVAVTFISQPLLVLGLLTLTFTIALGSMGLTMLVFARAGRGRATALGWSAANRNMGLMLAAMGGVLPDLTWLYMGLAQFPIYLLPLLLQPAVRWWTASDRRG